VLDNLMDLVTDKDGQVDYFIDARPHDPLLLELLRGLGGAGINETVRPARRHTTVPAYRGVPIFRNDWIPTNRPLAPPRPTSVIFAGTLDDGSPSARHRRPDRLAGGWHPGGRRR
jgi:hypothetical protein